MWGEEGCGGCGGRGMWWVLEGCGGCGGNDVVGVGGRGMWWVWPHHSLDEEPHPEGGGSGVGRHVGQAPALQTMLWPIPRLLGHTHTHTHTQCMRRP